MGSWTRNIRDDCINSGRSFQSYDLRDQSDDSLIIDCKDERYFRRVKNIQLVVANGVVDSVFQAPHVASNLWILHKSLKRSEFNLL